MLYEKRSASTAKSNRPRAVQVAAVVTVACMSLGMIGCAGLSIGPRSTSGSSGTSVKVNITPEAPTVVSGGEIQLSASVTNTMDTGVSWSAGSGTISTGGLFKEPTVQSTTTVTVIAKSLSIVNLQDSILVTITPIPQLEISTTSLPKGTAGSGYSSTLVGTGGTQPYTWSISSGSLPSGLQLNSSSGVLSGTTDSAGTFTFSAQLADAGGNKATQQLQLSMGKQVSQICGPPAYSCSRTDSQIIAAKAPPHLGSNSIYYGGHLGAGVVAIDPAYNNRILRVTDGNTQPTRPGLSYMTGSSAEKNVSSYDESLFIVHGDNGGICLFQFNASAFSSHFHGCFGNIGTSGDFGYTAEDQYAFYAYYLQKLYRFVIDPSTWTISADPTFNNGIGYFDPDGPNCLNGLIAQNNWYTGDSALSSDDNTVIVAVGPAQDADPYYVVWNRTNGCQWMNVQTWRVSAGWNTGLSNPQKISWASGTVPSGPGGIHNAQLDRSGNYGVLAINGVASLGHKVFWTIGTNQVDDTCASCHSHWSCDFGVCFWQMGPGTGYSLMQQSIGSLQPILDVNTNASQGQWGNDEHMSHANAEPNQKLIYLTSFQPGSGADSVNQVWEDELIGVNWDGSQRTIRFNKSWNSGYGGFNGSARCSISRQGHYAICDSDLQMYNLDKGFGNGFNQDTCDHNLPSALISTNGCRTDVLLFELR
jgi:hypothetical protein